MDYMKTLSYLTAFVSGFITMSLEILGFRALAPHFGYSIYVFGTLIGLILFALAVGYWVGGTLSRRNIKARTFFLILLSAGLYIAAASAFYEQIIQSLADYSVITGAFFATFILWAFPMAVLAAVSPYLVGKMSEKDHPGQSSGKISAAGTIGGLAGTFLTSFYLLPAFGTHATFVGNAYAATAMALLWLSLYDKKWLLAAIVAPLLAHTMPPINLPPNVVHAEESAYSHLEVVDRGDMLVLRTDRRSGTAYSAIMKDGGLPPFLLYNLFAAPVAAKNSKRGLLLGGGTGTLPRIHEILNPDLSLTVVEIDPRVIAIGEEFFKLNDLKNIGPIIIDDARPFLTKDTTVYDVIEMDIFRETEIPFYLVSKEFFELTKDRLSENGILMMNIYDPNGDRRIEKRITNTIASVYPNTYVVSAGFGSFFVVGSKTPLVIPDTRSGASDERLIKLLNYFRDHSEKIVFSANEEVFTDDLAPIETLYVAPPAKIFYNKGT